MKYSEKMTKEELNQFMAEIDSLDAAYAAAAEHDAKVLQAMRERNPYRDVLAEIAEELLPKLKQIHARLHAGSDAMRDEGHKLMLVCDDLESILGGK